MNMKPVYIDVINKLQSRHQVELFHSIVLYFSGKCPDHFLY